MTPAGFREPAPEHAVVAIEEHQIKRQILALRERDRLGDERLDVEVARSNVHVDGDGGQVVVLRGQQPPQQAEGQVVDRLVSEVLEHLQGRRLPGPRHAGDQDHRYGRVVVHRRCRSATHCGRSPCARAAVRGKGACPRHWSQRTVPGREHGQGGNGNSTVKHAPTTSPSSFRRFSARMSPPCAATICLEMLSPSPECAPKASPSGRSV